MKLHFGGYRKWCIGKWRLCIFIGTCWHCTNTQQAVHKTRRCSIVLVTTTTTLHLICSKTHVSKGTYPVYANTDLLSRCTRWKKSTPLNKTGPNCYHNCTLTQIFVTKWEDKEHLWSFVQGKKSAEKSKIQSCLLTWHSCQLRRLSSLARVQFYYA